MRVERSRGAIVAHFDVENLRFAPIFTPKCLHRLLLSPDGRKEKKTAYLVNYSRKKQGFENRNSLLERRLRLTLKNSFYEKIIPFWGTILERKDKKKQSTQTALKTQMMKKNYFGSLYQIIF